MYLYLAVIIINVLKIITISDIFLFYRMIQTNKRTDFYGKTNY